jgi:hypothetical protein
VKQELGTEVAYCLWYLKQHAHVLSEEERQRREVARCEQACQPFVVDLVPAKSVANENHDIVYSERTT